MSEVPKKIYRIIEQYEEYYVQLWFPPVPKWIFFKTEGYWSSLEVCDSIEEAKQSIARMQRYSDGPNVLWQSNVDEELEGAVFDDN